MAFYAPCVDCDGHYTHAPCSGEIYRNDMDSDGRCKCPQCASHQKCSTSDEVYAALMFVPNPRTSVRWGNYRVLLSRFGVHLSPYRGFKGYSSRPTWVNMLTGKLAKRPSWARRRLMDLISKPLPHHKKREWYVAFPDTYDKGPVELHKMEMGAIAKAGRYIGWEFDLERLAAEVENFPTHLHSFLYEQLAYLPRATVVKPQSRKKYTRSPKLDIVVPTYTDRQDARGFCIPRWSVTRAVVNHWELSDEVPAEQDNQVYIKPHNFKAPAKEKPGQNTWCHTFPQECEFTDPRPMTQKIQQYLEDEGLGHLTVRYAQRRFLRYISDGCITSQSGVLRDSNGEPREWAKRPLLFEGECWMIQLEVPNEKAPLMRSPIFITDDMTFIATHQCLRVGQTENEYKNKGINLYSPNEAPMSLAEFIKGPATDHFCRGNFNDPRLANLRPTLAVHKPQVKLDPAKVQAAMLKAVQHVVNKGDAQAIKNAIYKAKKDAVLQLNGIGYLVSLQFGLMCAGCGWEYGNEDDNTDAWGWGKQSGLAFCCSDCYYDHYDPDDFNEEFDEPEPFVHQSDLQAVLKAHMDKPSEVEL